MKTVKPDFPLSISENVFQHQLAYSKKCAIISFLNAKDFKRSLLYMCIIIIGGPSSAIPTCGALRHSRHSQRNPKNMGHWGTSSSSTFQSLAIYINTIGANDKYCNLSSIFCIDRRIYKFCECQFNNYTPEFEISIIVIYLNSKKNSVVNEVHVHHSPL